MNKRNQALALLIFIALTGCKPPQRAETAPAVNPGRQEQLHKEFETSTGLGMRLTPGGPAIGIELAPGVVMGMDGQIGVGIGF